MKKIKSFLGIFLSFIMVLGIFSPQYVYADEEKKDYKISVLSDIHVLKSELIEKNDAFDKAMNSDRKMFVQSEGLLNSGLDIAKNNGSKIVLVSGDLTKDGEYISHEYVNNILKEYEKENNAEVFVVPGNHDINNLNALDFTKYNQETEKVENARLTNSDEYMEIYNELLYKDALELYKDSKEFKRYQEKVGRIGKDAQGYTSYISRVGDKSNGITIIGLDTAIYTGDVTNDGKDIQTTNGMVTTELLEWAIRHIKDAKIRNDEILVIGHHGFIPHFGKQKELLAPYLLDNFDQAIVNGKTPAEALADEGVNYIFTGHMHANDISKMVTKAGNKIYDIETGSTVTYPSPVRNLILSTEILKDKFKSTLDIKTEHIKEVDYIDENKEEKHIDDIQKISKEFLISSELINNYIDIIVNSPEVKEDGIAGIINAISRLIGGNTEFSLEEILGGATLGEFAWNYLASYLGDFENPNTIEISDGAIVIDLFKKHENEVYPKSRVKRSLQDENINDDLSEEEIEAYLEELFNSITGEDIEKIINTIINLKDTNNNSLSREKEYNQKEKLNIIDNDLDIDLKGELNKDELGDIEIEEIENNINNDILKEDIINNENLLEKRVKREIITDTEDKIFEGNQDIILENEVDKSTLDNQGELKTDLDNTKKDALPIGEPIAIGIIVKGTVFGLTLDNGFLITKDNLISFINNIYNDLENNIIKDSSKLHSMVSNILNGLLKSKVVLDENVEVVEDSLTLLDFINELYMGHLYGDENPSDEIVKVIEDMRDNILLKNIIKNIFPTVLDELKDKGTLIQYNPKLGELVTVDSSYKQNNFIGKLALAVITAGLGDNIGDTISKNEGLGDMALGLLDNEAVTSLLATAETMIADIAESMATESFEGYSKYRYDEDNNTILSYTRMIESVDDPKPTDPTDPKPSEPDYNNSDDRDPYISEAVEPDTDYVKSDSKKIADISGHWGEDIIKKIVEKEYMDIKDNKFYPDEKSSRIEIIKSLAKIEKVNISSYIGESFSDIDSKSEISGYINWARDNGIINGYEDGEFKPERPIIREEMAKILNIYVEKFNSNFENGKAIEFLDENEIGNWAKPYVKKATEQGLLKGNANGYFKPKDNITRAELAQIIYNIISK